MPYLDVKRLNIDKLTMGGHEQLRKLCPRPRRRAVSTGICRKSANSALEPEEEYMLAKRPGRRKQDTKAAHKMVTSHLRLAAKIAMGYRGYGLPQAEVISEANVGLMQAVKRFDPEKGFRLATYAMWWICASDSGIYPALVEPW